MKLIKVALELVIDDNDFRTDDPYPDTDAEGIANYLNNKLYTDPEFFGDFGPENIVEIKEWE